MDDKTIESSYSSRTDGSKSMLRQFVGRPNQTGKQTSEYLSRF